MTTSLAARPSAQPLPMGTALARRAVSYGSVIFPGPENFLWGGPGSAGQTGETGVFNRPERFWLHAGASFICYNAAANTWTRYDYELRLVVNGNYGNDLNGINFFQKANPVWGSAGDPWLGVSISGLFFCEANTNYTVYLLSKGSPANVYYYQSPNHYNIWAYTIGEGAY